MNINNGIKNSIENSEKTISKILLIFEYEKFGKIVFLSNPHSPNI